MSGEKNGAEKLAVINQSLATKKGSTLGCISEVIKSPIIRHEGSKIISSPHTLFRIGFGIIPLGSEVIINDEGQLVVPFSRHANWPDVFHNPLEMSIVDGPYVTNQKSRDAMLERQPANIPDLLQKIPLDFGRMRFVKIAVGNTDANRFITGIAIPFNIDLEAVMNALRSR